MPTSHPRADLYHDGQRPICGHDRTIVERENWEVATVASTTLPTVTPRTVPPRLRRVGSTLATWAASGAKVTSAARHRLRRPALVIGGLGFMDAAAYQGPLWLGLLVTGVSLWVFEGISGGDE